MENVIEKYCLKCKVKKPLLEYHKKPNSIDGRDSRCAVCMSNYKKQFNQKLKTKKNNQIHVSASFSVTMDVTADFCALVNKIAVGGVNENPERN